MTIQDVRNAIANFSSNFYVSSEFCHPERVTDEAMRIAENSALDYLMNAPDFIIEEAIAEVEGIVSVLQYIANWGADYSGYSTITVTIHQHY